jgi:putative serine protease PepD
MTDTTTATLQVRWDGGGLSAAPDQAPLLVGRADGAAVPVTGRSVSREHLRLLLDEGRWVAVDHSTRGTYRPDGARVDRAAVGPDEVRLHLGSPDGPAITLTAVSEGRARDHGRDGAHQQGPIVPRIDAGVPWTVATDDPTLRIDVDGRKHVFNPPGRVVVGRDPGCDVVCDSDLVSRQHLVFTSNGHGWTMEDLGSSRGTFVDGRKLRRPRAARGGFVVMLGGDDAGERLQVVTAGAHRTPRSRAPLVGGLAAVVVAAVVALAVLSPDDDRDVANTPAHLDLAARSTVHIAILDQDGQPMGYGSGVVVDSSGLVLTNAHVADPAWGLLETDAAAFGIFVVDDRSEPFEGRYVAEHVVTHPSVDAALLRIVADADGRPVDGVDTEILRLGDSDALTGGDKAHQLGFPGTAYSDEISVAEVTIQSFAPLEMCSEVPVDQRRSCSDGEPQRDGLMNYTGADLGGGSSGGPFVHQGELVAINVGVVGLERDEFQEFALPVHTIRDWLADNGVPG